MVDKVQNYETVQERIKKCYGDFSKSESRVAAFFADNYSEAILLSSSELAKRTNVSDTTVLRFARTLGYKSFLELKKAVRITINKDNSPYDNVKKMQTAQPDDALQNHIANVINDMQHFAQHLDGSGIEEVAQAVLSAKTIYVMGIGSDSTPARFLFIYLRKLGFSTVFLQEEGSGLKESARNISQEDILILFSFPRFLKDEKKITQLAKSHKATLITITDSNATALFYGSDLNIIIKEERKAFFNSYVLAMLFCNLLLLHIYEIDSKGIETKLKNYVDFIQDIDWV